MKSFFFGLLLSCGSSFMLPNHFYSTVQTDERLKFLDDNSDREEESICLTEGKNFHAACWTAPHCRNFCEELFINKKEERECQNWPLQLANRFSDLYETMNNGVFQDISAKTLKCFLKLTKNNPILFKPLNEEESKEFLLEIASNSNFAYYLSGEDKGDFSVLTALFRKLSGRLIRSVKESLGYGKNNFLIEIHRESNKPAWNWLNDYLIYLCHRDSKCAEPLEYYCEILKKAETETLEDFFDNNTWFKNGYRGVIGGKQCGGANCVYGDIPDFENMCNGL